MNVDCFSMHHIKPDRSAEAWPDPPTAEKRLILVFLKSATEGADNAIQTTLRQITSVVEFRTRLVADVVTGKLDVRDAAARLPDYTSELEAEMAVDEEFDEEAATDDDAIADAAE
jgi:type I restriction enzyme S subunit